jgi:integrase
MTRKSKYEKFLRDENVKRWYRNVCRGSKITGDVYLRRLGHYCEEKGIIPKEIAEMSKRDLWNLFLDLVSEMEDEGYAGSYIKSNLKALKSWLRFNHIEVKGKVNIDGVSETPTLKDEVVPTQKQLRKVFLSSDLRTKVVCSLAAHTGLRFGVLKKYKVEDGLRVKDFPELEIRDEKVEFKKIPTRVVIRRKLSKNGKQYFTFLSQEGCEYLKEYLESRLRKGEPLTKESPIIASKLSKDRGKFITSITIGKSIRRVFKKVGVDQRPYILRSFFDTQLLLSESKGLVLRDYRQFWMGHSGDIERRYTLGKENLPPELVEDMRESYRKSQNYLQTIEIKREEDIQYLFKKQFLNLAGFKNTEVKEEFFDLETEDFQKIIRKRLTKEILNNGVRQKLVEVNEIENYLRQGWEFVNILPNQKVILKLPSLPS